MCCSFSMTSCGHDCEMTSSDSAKRCCQTCNLISLGSFSRVLSGAVAMGAIVESGLRAVSLDMAKTEKREDCECGKKWRKNHITTEVMHCSVYGKNFGKTLSLRQTRGSMWKEH